MACSMGEGQKINKRQALQVPSVNYSEKYRNDLGAGDGMLNGRGAKRVLTAGATGSNR
jgi:hypothetical protein